MTGGYDIKQNGTIYTFTKEVSGKKVVVTVNDKDGDKSFDYQDTISFKGDQATFESLKSSELFTALNAYVRPASYETSKLSNVVDAPAIPIVKKGDKPYINPNLNDTEYSFSTVYEAFASKQKSTTTTPTNTGASSGSTATTAGSMGIGGGFSGIDSTSIGGSGATLNPMAALQLNNIGIGGSGMLAAFNMMGMNSMFAPLIAGMMPGFGVNIADSVNSMLINGLSKMDYKTDPDSINVTDAASFAKKWNRKSFDLSKPIEKTDEETAEAAAASEETDEVGFGDPDAVADSGAGARTGAGAGAGAKKPTKIPGTTYHEGETVTKESGSNVKTYTVDGVKHLEVYDIHTNKLISEKTTGNGKYTCINYDANGNKSYDASGTDEKNYTSNYYNGKDTWIKREVFKDDKCVSADFRKWARKGTSNTFVVVPFKTAEEMKKAREGQATFDLGKNSAELEALGKQRETASVAQSTEITAKTKELQKQAEIIKTLKYSPEMQALETELAAAWKAYDSDGSSTTKLKSLQNAQAKLDDATAKIKAGKKITSGYSSTDSFARTGGM